MKQHSITRQTLRLYWQHAKLFRKQLLAIIVLMPIIQLADDFIVPLYTSKILTMLVRNTGQLQLHTFYHPLLIILIIELSVNLFWRPYVKIVWAFEENVMRELYHTSFNHLMKMSYRFYSDRFAGSLVNQVNKFSSAFERLADTLIWSIYKLIIAFVFTLIILAGPAPLYVISMLICSLIFIVILVSLKRTERPYNERWSSAESERTGQLADSIGNIVAVKAFAQESREIALFEKETDKVHRLSLETMRKVLGNERYTTTSQRVINVAAILSSLYLAVHSSIPIGTIYLALVYTTRIVGKLWDLNSVLRNFNRVFGDARDMTTILAIKPEVQDTSTRALKAIRGAIEFKNVTFAYPESPDKPLFKNLNLRIKPGEKVGLVGPSGGGKTTITMLLLRFMDIQSGSITIDRQDIAQTSQHSLRHSIAYVPQEPLMFHRSIADNITYGELGANQKAIEGVAKMANAHDFIVKLAKGYDTFVGERGTKLSGGQRQRIAIARAMLKNSPILLLDEATSALDSESEVLIQDALWKLMEGRTAIVIAHRLSTIQKMDRIIVLENGQVVEQGSHKELLQLDGTYAKLWAHQSGGFIED